MNLYSITSSAATSKAFGVARPSAFAVLRLTSSSNCVGCSIGKSGRHHDKTGAWEMHTDLSDRGIAASDNDLMDARGDQLADDRVASGVIRRDGHCLTRFPADRILRIGDYAGDGRSVPRRI